MTNTLPPQIVDLTPYYGVIRVSGPAALSFLQGQLTCDMREINASTLQLGGFCTPQGRLRALFKIFKKSDPSPWKDPAQVPSKKPSDDPGIFYLILPKSLLPASLTQLKKYALFSKVVIEEEQDINIFGWQAEREGLASSSEEQNVWDRLGREQEKIKIPGNHLNHVNQIAFLKALGSLPRFQIIGPQVSMKPLWKKLSRLAAPCDFNEWCLWDIRQGIPEIWPETTEQFFPHHLNLPNLGGVSFTKGCYCGQEIVAKMHYRGNVKRRMVWGVLPDCDDLANLFSAGTELFLENDQTDVVRIITVTKSSSTGQIEALVKIPNRLLPEQINAEGFVLRIKVAHLLKNLIIQPLLLTPSI